MNVIAPTPYHIAPPPRVRVGHERACVCACATLFPQRRNSCYISGLFGVRACSASEMPPLRSQLPMSFTVLVHHAMQLTFIAIEWEGTERGVVIECHIKAHNMML